MSITEDKYKEIATISFRKDWFYVLNLIEDCENLLCFMIRTYGEFKGFCLWLDYTDYVCQNTLSILNSSYPHSFKRTRLQEVCYIIIYRLSHVFKCRDIHISYKNFIELHIFSRFTEEDIRDFSLNVDHGSFS